MNVQHKRILTRILTKMAKLLRQVQSEYPPESAIRKSFIKRVEKNRQELAPEIYNIQMLAQL